MSRLTYAMQAWGGFLSKELIDKIDAFLCKAKRFGYALNVRKTTDILADADTALFHRIVNNNSHCLHNLLPVDESQHDMTLRRTNYCLPKYNYRLYRNSFIVRLIYQGSY